MNEGLKKIFLVGLGATLASKEKADQLFNDLSKNGGAAADELRQFLDKFSEKGKTKTDAFQTDLKSDIRQSLQELGFVSGTEYSALKTKVEALESELKAIKENHSATND
ncbi:MAG: hypothetical protein ABF868_03085 [Sporolactobacillus sp.]